MNPAHTRPVAATKAGIKSCRSCAHYLHTLTQAGDYKMLESRCDIKTIDPVSGRNRRAGMPLGPHLAAPLRLGRPVVGTSQVECQAVTWIGRIIVKCLITT